MLLVRRGANTKHNRARNFDDVVATVRHVAQQQTHNLHLLVKEFEDMPATEQLRLVHSSDIVVLSRGSATANLVMRRRQGSINPTGSKSCGRKFPKKRHSKFYKY